MRYTVKVAAGPGTAGYEHHTAKQNAKKSSWASFTLLSDAEAFATTTRIAHPTWIVTVHDMENERYRREADISCGKCGASDFRNCTCKITQQPPTVSASTATAPQERHQPQEGSKMKGQTLTTDSMSIIRQALTEGALEHRIQLANAILEGFDAIAGHHAKLIMRNERAQYAAWALPWPCGDDQQPQAAAGEKLAAEGDPFQPWQASEPLTDAEYAEAYPDGNPRKDLWEPQRPSSVELVKKYLPTKDADEAGAEILKHAADYLYNQIPEPRTWEQADRGIATAVDLIDSLREYAGLTPEERAAVDALD